MSSAFRRTLPARPDLDQQRKLAKQLLRAYRAGDPEAAARMRAALPDKAELSLTDAQYVLAREYGFTSWRELKEKIEQRAVEHLPPIERFKRAVQEGDAKSLRAVLERHADERALIDAPIFSFNSPALVTIGSSTSTRSTCCSSSAPIRTAAVTGGREDSIRCTASAARRPSISSRPAPSPMRAPRRTSIAPTCWRR